MNNIIQNWKSSTLTGLRKFDNEIGIWLQVVVCFMFYVVQGNDNVVF